MHTRLKQCFKALCALAIVGTLIFIYLLTSGFGTPKSASADTAVESTGLGLSINAVKTTTLDLRELKDGSPIFDTTWLQSQKENANFSNVSRTSNSSFYSAKFKEVSQKYNSKFSFNSSVSLGIDLFTVGVSSGFERSTSSSFNNKMSQYYYIFNSQIERYTLSLPNYSSNLAAYKANLNTNFLSALAKVFNNTMSYEAFFDMYGTHVVMKGVYGGALNLFYRAASDLIDVGYTTSTVLSNSITESIDNVINGNASTFYSAQSLLNCLSNEITEYTYITANGGTPFTGTSFNNFNSHYTEWANSVVNNPVLVSTTNDGLVPLWELLPDNYSSYTTAFKQAYINYITNYQNSILDNYDKKEISKYTISIEKTETRTGEYQIFDNNPFKNSYDTVKIDELYSYDTFKRLGFKTITITLKLEMKEKDNGNQNFYLVGDLNQSCETPFSHVQVKWGGAIRKKSYGNKDIDFGSYPLETFKNDMGFYNKFKPVIIRYGSSGSGDNRWYNQNATITVKFSK